MARAPEAPSSPASGSGVVCAPPQHWRRAPAGVGAALLAGPVPPVSRTAGSDPPTEQKTQDQTAALGKLRMGFTASHCPSIMETTHLPNPARAVLSPVTSPRAGHRNLGCHYQETQFAKLTSLSRDASIEKATMTPTATPLLMLCITKGFIIESLAAIRQMSSRRSSHYYK